MSRSLFDILGDVNSAEILTFRTLTSEPKASCVSGDRVGSVIFDIITSYSVRVEFQERSLVPSQIQL